MIRFPHDWTSTFPPPQTPGRNLYLANNRRGAQRIDRLIGIYHRKSSQIRHSSAPNRNNSKFSRYGPRSELHVTPQGNLDLTLRTYNSQLHMATYKEFCSESSALCSIQS